MRYNQQHNFVNNIISPIKTNYSQSKKNLLQQFITDRHHNDTPIKKIQQHHTPKQSKIVTNQKRNQKSQRAFYNSHNSTPKKQGLLSKTKRQARQRNQISPAPSRLTTNDQKFYQLEDILTRQNFNLKQHRDYLLKQVKKCSQVIKKYKNKLKQYEQKIYQLQHENDVYRLQYMQMRKYVFEGMNRMQQIAERNNQSNQQNLTQENLLSDDHQKNISEETTFKQFEQKNINKTMTINNSFGGQFSPTLNSNNYKNQIKKNQTLQNYLSTPYNQSKSINLNTDRIKPISQNSSNQQQHLRQLNLKFQDLISQYNTNKDWKIMDKCKQIAKQIKNIRNNVNNTQLHAYKYQNPESFDNLNTKIKNHKYQLSQQSNPTSIQYSQKNEDLRDTQKGLYVPQNNYYQSYDTININNHNANNQKSNYNDQYNYMNRNNIINRNYHQENMRISGNNNIKNMNYGNNIVSMKSSNANVINNMNQRRQGMNLNRIHRNLNGNLHI